MLIMVKVQNLNRYKEVIIVHDKAISIQYNYLNAYFGKGRHV